MARCLCGHEGSKNIHTFRYHLHFFGYLKRLVFQVVVSNIFYVHPNLGKISNLTNIFQTVWNHQPVFFFFGFVFFQRSSWHQIFSSQTGRSFLVEKKQFPLLSIRLPVAIECLAVTLSNRPQDMGHHIANTRSGGMCGSATLCDEPRKHRMQVLDSW